MSSGWSEDPELSRLRDTFVDEAKNQQDLADNAKRDMDAFMHRYKTMVTGGLRQAKGVFRASGKFVKPLILNSPRSEEDYYWRISGQISGDYFTVLSFSLTASKPLYQCMAHLGNEGIPLEDFSEQWFREKLREAVRKLLS